MTFYFTESVSFSLPDVQEELHALRESYDSARKGLVVEVAGIHEGMTANFNYYPGDALEESVQSWVTPYPKPIILNHDLETEPIGRVIAAKLDRETDGTPFIRLQIAISDPEAIEKVSDGRYLTGSVGGKAESASCSICGTDWVKASASTFESPCKHRRGKMYKEKVAFLEMSGVSWKEYSIVNVPADERSGVRSIGSSKADGEENDGWVRPARVFSIDMDKEEVVEHGGSKDHNVFESLSPKDAEFSYTHLKGAFLSAIADAPAITNEEKSMELEPTENEDILAVSEQLSSDLSTTVEEEVEEPEVPATEPEEEPEVAPEDEPTTEDPEETVEVPEETEEAPEVPAEDPVDEPVFEPEVEPAADDAEVEPEVEVEEPEEEPEVEAPAESELTDRLQALESENTALRQRNERLEFVLKKSLAERVVDSKIALGLAEADARENEIVEHMGRSASSLADSLRDISKMPSVTTSNNVSLPTEHVEQGVVVIDNNSVVEESDRSVVQESDDSLDAEQLFVDALMGRRKL